MQVDLTGKIALVKEVEELTSAQAIRDATYDFVSLVAQTEIWNSEK